MVNVAVAGGTGSVGRTLVEALQAHPKHNTIVLTRKDPGKDIGAPVVEVNYNDVESLKDILEKHNIDTVISTISILGEREGNGQINLIKAAAKSSVTKRFAPSEWGIPYPEEDGKNMPLVKYKLLAADELRKTDLKWTKFSNGFFLDYFGMPHVKSYLMRQTFSIDIENKAAAIPGTGNEKVDFTYTFDVAKFVVASLDLPEWPEDSLIIGDKKTFNEVLKIAEEARGSKFTVAYDPLEKLERFEITELPAHHAAYQFVPKEVLQPMTATFGQWTAKSLFDMPYEKSLNVRLPDIKTVSVKELIGQAWGGK
ncbi:hypothetical protein A1O9_00362 [Neofusicoccum parvum]|nr:hypothetical protein A1O9_00362 [Neofusicoccum parvum]